MGDDVQQLEHEENTHKKVKSALTFDTISPLCRRKVLQKTLFLPSVDKNEMCQTFSALVTPETLVFPQERSCCCTLHKHMQPTAGCNRFKHSCACLWPDVGSQRWEAHHYRPLCIRAGRWGKHGHLRLEFVWLQMLLIPMSSPTFSTVLTRSFM